MGRRLGLIIGVNSYQDTAFRPLQYAETDARAIAQWLVNVKGGNWSPADVQQVHGTHATRELVESLILQTCVRVAEPDDVVLIYFAGQAFVDEKSGEGYLALANTVYQQPATGLNLLSIARQALGNSKAGHILFMLDCFQTGPVWDRQRSSPYDFKPLLGPTILSAVQQMGNRLFLCSCRGSAQAPETGDKLGAFAYQTIIGLCGPAIDSTTGQTTLQKLTTFLNSALAEQQKPQVFGYETAPLVLAGPSAPVTPQKPNLSQPFSPPPAQSATGSLQPEPGRVATATAPFAPQNLPTTPAQSASAGSDAQVQQQCTMLLRQARHLVQMQNFGEAFNTAERILQLSPQNVAALTIKGQLLGTAGRFQEAGQVVEQIIQLEPGNALAWSMKAALLTNMGQYQEALQAVEHSLELDPNNTETYAIKTSITGRIAAMKLDNKSRPEVQRFQQQGGRTSFLIGLGVQLVGFILGIVGAALPVLRPGFPAVLVFVLESFGLAILCVNATRGAYRYGFTRALVTLLTSILAAAILGGLFKFGYTHLLGMIRFTPSLLVPVLFLAGWLAAAALLPLLLAIVGLIAGFIARIRRKS